MDGQEDQIADAAVDFFKNQFKEGDEADSYEILNEILVMNNDDQKEEIQKCPSKEELKTAVMRLNRHSAEGPDGMTGAFYQDTWYIAGDDICNMIKSFFCGAELSKFVTHTNLVLLPKKLVVNTFLDMRTISLSNFVNKIFSRIIHERIEVVLPYIISPEHVGFVQRRSIAENVLLVQEIITKIRKRGKPPNLVIKLDMRKAYDRLEWIYLAKVLRRMGFGERLIDMVFRLVGNNWYSILSNGQPKGFFQSSRGMKQEDPLSSTLFIIAAEVISRSLNSLMKKKEFKPFGMPRGSPKLNHMAFADDVIILCKYEIQTLQIVRRVLEGNDKLSRQKINKEKSSIYLHQNVSQGRYSSSRSSNRYSEEGLYFHLPRMS
ncbi:uncharacterized protein LOC129883482 [Solanum dulcamara]|uniref:uncharacterized protein LOC129883482 n=1 Tax=Solanum dulcamara TaxID=45834 RepID=UPI002484F81E|nr:uncharacterized protein LOC129883482 [Solanum dulcamara]